MTTDGRGGDYIEQHYVLDLPRLEDGVIDNCIQIPVGDDVDMVTLNLTDIVKRMVEEYD